MFDNNENLITVGADVLLVYAEGDCDNGTVISVNEDDYSVNVQIGDRVVTSLPEDVIVLVPSDCPNCGGPGLADSHDEGCFDAVPDPRTTIDLCGDCWETARPDEYFPFGYRFGTCGVCGYDAFVVRVSTNNI